MTDTHSAESSELPATAGIGRVALYVESLDRVLPFYRDVLGFGVERRRDGSGDGGERAYLTAGGETLVVLRERADASPRGESETGLFHVAIRVPDRAALADALARIRREGATLTGASDHLVSEALYLRDPGDNGIEVYRDRPREEWPRADDGGVAMDTLPLDLDDLAGASGTDDADATGRAVESGDAGGAAALPAGTDIGHVHLEVADLSRAEAFYADALGLNVRARYADDAAFLAAGEYHHHVGLNTWNGRRSPAGESLGLAWFEVTLPDAGALDGVRRRLEDRGYAVESAGADAGADGDERGDRDPPTAVDPDGIHVRLVVGE